MSSGSRPIVSELETSGMSHWDPRDPPEFTVAQGDSSGAHTSSPTPRPLFLSCSVCGLASASWEVASLSESRAVMSDTLRPHGV